MNAPVQVDAHNAFEPAARIYCVRIGVDPDAVRKLQHPFIAGMTVDVPAWKLEAERLLDLSTMLSAMKAAAQQGKAP